MFTRSEEETGVFFSMIPEYGVCGHFTICSLYPLERFGKMLFSCRVSAETERHEPTWARLMVFGLRHEQQRSGLDVMQCTRLPVERDRRSAMQAGEAVCIKHAAPEPCAVNH